MMALILFLELLFSAIENWPFLGVIVFIEAFFFVNLVRALIDMIRILHR